METINVEWKTKNDFERLRLDLRTEEKSFISQDELLGRLIKSYKGKK